MQLHDYEQAARATALYPNIKGCALYPVLGLCGEAGEVAEKVKKVLRDHSGVMSPIHKQEIAKELGDVLWYLTNIALDLGFSLEAIARINIEKLASCQQRDQLHGSGDNR